MSSLFNNNLNISTLPITKMPDEYFNLVNEFRAVSIICLSSFFSFFDPIISNPI